VFSFIQVFHIGLEAIGFMIDDDFFFPCPPVLKSDGKTGV
jgi:hypothetical protein